MVLKNNNMYKNGKLTAEARKKLKAKQAAGSKKSKAKKVTMATEPAECCERSCPAPTCPKPLNNLSNLNIDDEDSDCLLDSPPRCSKVKARAAALAANQDANWVKIIEHNTAEGALEENQMFSFQIRLDKQSKAGLRAQLKDREERKEQEYQKKLEYQQELREQFESWEQEDALKQVASMAKIAQMKKERAEQIALLDKRRQKEIKRQAMRDKREQLEIKKALQAEKDKNLARRKEKIALMKQIRLDNEIERAKKLEAEVAEKELTKLQMKQYAAKIKAQEEARAARLAATYAAQDAKQASLVKSTEGARAAEKASILRAERERRHYEQIADERERKKVQARKDFMTKIKASVAEQLQEREAAIKKTVADDREYGRRIAEETAKWEADEKQKEAARRKVSVANSKFILKQVSANVVKKQQERAEMNPTEQKMNSGLLKNVKEGKLNAHLVYDPKHPYAWKNQRKTGIF